jgi:hypothetical protein
MPKDDFSNREITLMFEHIKEQLIKIETQTTKTNGRVSKLETEQAGMIGKIGVLATLGATVLGTIAQKVFANF